MVEIKRVVNASHDVVLKGDGAPVILLDGGGPGAACGACEPIWRPASRGYVVKGIIMCAVEGSGFS